MLRAVLSGKAGTIRRDGSELSMSWREAFRANEDLLTAAFFGRLPYLSDNARANLMELMIGDGAKSLGELVEFDLWPHLKKLEGRRLVEPDVVVRFENATVMVEVKPPGWGGQSFAQWKAEIDALTKEMEADDGEFPDVVHFVALGGNGFKLTAEQRSDISENRPFTLHVHQREWEQVAAGLTSLDFSTSAGDSAVVSDLMAVLRLYGVSKPVPRWRSLLEFSADHALDLTCFTSQPCQSEPRDAIPAPALPDWSSLVAYADRHLHHLK